MIIKLPKSFNSSIIQLCLDTIDSHTDPEDPKALTRTCEQFFQELSGNVDLLMEEQSYAVLTLLGKIKVADKTRTIKLIEKDELPDWSEILVAESRQNLVNDLRAKNDNVAKKIVVLAFCLACGDEIHCAGKTILRANGEPINSEPPVKEVGEEGEEDHGTEDDN